MLAHRFRILQVEVPFERRGDWESELLLGEDQDKVYGIGDHKERSNWIG